MDIILQESNWAENFRRFYWASKYFSLNMGPDNRTTTLDSGDFIGPEDISAQIFWYISFHTDVTGHTEKIYQI